jgi:hypothetical protein
MFSMWRKGVFLSTLLDGVRKQETGWLQADCGPSKEGLRKASKEQGTQDGGGETQAPGRLSIRTPYPYRKIPYGYGFMELYRHI